MPVLFTLTLFVSAFLLFLVQPMLARMVLPLLGGTPAVWNTCMVFFQALLLAGYSYSHALPAWLGTRRQAVLHVGVLLLPLLVLPIALPSGWTPPETGNPVPALLMLLFITVGLPFFVVSTSGPLLQRWFAATGHRHSHDPYFLYAASNCGSMLALLGYPFLFEPRFGLVEQSRLWSAGYSVLILLTLLCACVVWRTAPADSPSSDQPVDQLPALPWKRRLRWVLLAFVPSSLMLSVTTYLTTDIAAIPLLWVLPLSLYLLTFILVFGRRPVLPLSVAIRWMSLVVLAIVFVLLSEATEPVGLVIGIHLLGLFWIGMVCHGLLAADRPPVGHLTEFYLWLSVGGVLGGLFNALLAPLVFNSILEYPIVLVLACLLRPASWSKPLKLPPLEESLSTPPGAIQTDRTPALTAEPDPTIQVYPSTGDQWTQEQSASGLPETIRTSELPVPAVMPDSLIETDRAANGRKRDAARRRLDFALPLTLAVTTAAIILGCQAAGISAGPKSVALMFAAPVIACYFFTDRPLRLGLGISAVLLASSLYQGVLGKVEYRTRSFFGVHRVTRQGEFRVLAHGNTIHGKQSLDPDRRGKPLTYYYPTGPVGHLFAAMKKDPRLHRVGVIGLGSGSIVAYAGRGQHWTYFEIDPAVGRIARDPALFTFYTDAEAGGVQVDTVFGDARLTLERTDERFGVIFIDAFSSDAIPVHLLTREALQVYFSRLEKGGLLVFNISNRYLDLEPVLAALAEDVHAACLFEDDRIRDANDDKNGKTMSQWGVMARNARDLPKLRTNAGVWAPPTKRTNLSVWTDDFSNLFQVFRSFQSSE